jgi:hypothetical protein
LAFGLGAGCFGPFLVSQTEKEIAMSSLFRSSRIALGFGVVAALLIGLCPAVTTAQSVRGHGKISSGPAFSPSEISVNVWIGADGVARGKMVWIGDVAPPYTPGTSGPAENVKRMIQYH